MLIREIPDTKGLFAEIRHQSLSKLSARKKITALGAELAHEVKSTLTKLRVRPDQMLFAILLRGGAMMYPGFLSAFPEADFCMIALRRSESGSGAPEVIYRSQCNRTLYRCVIYLDCITGTGRTVLRARNTIADCIKTDFHLAAVICGTAVASEDLQQSGVGLIGYSLNEALEGPLVLPDFGTLDAGDIFHSVNEDGVIPELEDVF